LLIDADLTDDQKVQWETYKINASLNPKLQVIALTDEQKGKIKKLVEDAAKAITKLTEGNEIPVVVGKLYEKIFADVLTDPQSAWMLQALTPSNQLATTGTTNAAGPNAGFGTTGGAFGTATNGMGGGGMGGGGRGGAGGGGGRGGGGGMGGMGGGGMGGGGMGGGGMGGMGGGGMGGGGMGGGGMGGGGRGGAGGGGMGGGGMGGRGGGGGGARGGGGGNAGGGATGLP